MKYIASFDEVALLSDQVRIRGSYVIVNALELNQLGALIYKHAALREAFDGQVNADGTKTGLFEAILAGGKDVVHDLIRTATGKEGDVSRLSASEQANIILACLTLTVPETDEEVADFLDQVAAFMVRARVAARLAKAKGMIGAMNRKG